MRDLMLRLVVGAVVVLLGVGVISLVTGKHVREIDLDLAYLLGALVISVPAIVIYERRRRRR